MSIFFCEVYTELKSLLLPFMTFQNMRLEAPITPYSYSSQHSVIKIVELIFCHSGRTAGSLNLYHHHLWNTVKITVRTSGLLDRTHHQQCQLCLVVLTGKCFMSSTSGHQFNFQHQLCCKTVSVIYMVTCVYGKQYLGETSHSLTKCFDLYHSDDWAKRV